MIPAASPDHPAGEVEVDPNPAPWRVLEDDPASQAAAPAPVPRGLTAVSRSAVMAGIAAVALALCAFVLAFGTGAAGAVSVQGGSTFEPVASDAIGAGAGTDAGTGRLLVVEIVGAVSHPGVFRLPPGARVGDLVAAAGGFGPRVDTGRAAQELNMAAALRDGDQVRVPSRDDSAASGTAATRPPGGGASSGQGGSKATGSISLNRATSAELDTLPGIGPATAAKIIGSREGQPFTSVQDLKTRKLVGDKTFEKLKDSVTVP